MKLVLGIIASVSLVLLVIRQFWYNTPRLAAAQAMHAQKNLVLNQTIL
jgi:hypothetical protein